VQQLGFGTLVGLAIGLAGGWLLGWARRKEWIAESAQQLAVVAMPLLCAVACEKFEASMFIAAFVAGLAVQAGFKEAGQHSVEFTEEWGQLINLSVFFPLGVMVARTWAQLTLAHFVYAILSLTVVRMLPVALALLGTRLNRATVLFIGWFGRVGWPPSCSVWFIWSRNCITRARPPSVSRSRRPCSSASLPTGLAPCPA